jgi:hypothetical protein
MKAILSKKVRSASRRRRLPPAGKYELSGKLKPGKYTVNVSGQMKASTPNAPLKSGDAMKPDDSTIPDSAVGNGQTIEITGPRNDLNFALKKPAK